MKTTFVVAVLAFALTASGCMTGYYAHRFERNQVAEEDTLAPPPMTIDDVIALARDSVGDNVILAQMKATRSVFRLTTSDIRDLKENGVSEAVINAMIKSDAEQKTFTRRVAYYNPYFAYYPDFYWDPFPSYYYLGYWYGSPWYRFPRASFYGGGHFAPRVRSSGRHR